MQPRMNEWGFENGEGGIVLQLHQTVIGFVVFEIGVFVFLVFCLIIKAIENFIRISDAIFNFQFLWFIHALLGWLMMMMMKWNAFLKLIVMGRAG